jgi:hypothetical protein
MRGSDMSDQSIELDEACKYISQLEEELKESREDEAYAVEDCNNAMARASGYQRELRDTKRELSDLRYGIVRLRRKIVSANRDSE